MADHPRIYVAGHRGLVGSAIVRALRAGGHTAIVTRSHAALELTDQAQVRAFFARAGIDEVYLAAAKVGGIHANHHYPAEFIYDNLMVQANVVHEAWRAGVRKLLFLGSSCIYPRLAPQPIREEYLMNGVLESTNEPYAMAKIAGIKLCESYNRQYGTDYRSVMPTNLYGPGDNYHPENSHVIPALLRRFHEAKTQAAGEVVIWGSGAPMREFLYVDDMASASVHVMDLAHDVYAASTDPMHSHLNVGTGQDVTIADLARLIGATVGYRGAIVFDASKPDGTPRKLLDVSRLSALGWRASTPLADGLQRAYAAFLGEIKRKPEHEHERECRSELGPERRPEHGPEPLPEHGRHDERNYDDEQHREHAQGAQSQQYRAGAGAGRGAGSGFGPGPRPGATGATGATGEFVPAPAKHHAASAPSIISRRRT